MADFHRFAFAFAAALPRRKVGFRHNTLGLLVEKGRQKDKLLVFEAQATCPLGNAAFADDNHLTAGTERFADNVPFF